MKLTKRVSDLEFKLASARKELHTVLHQDIPPVPPLAAFQIPIPTPTPTPDTDTDMDRSASPETPATTPVPLQRKPSTNKIVKKRRVNTDHDGDDAADATYKPVPTDSEADLSMSASEPERNMTRTKYQSSKKKLKRQTSRLTKSRSKNDLRDDEPMTIVPDGKKVPLVPAIPNGVEGKKAKVRDDGYGGFGHEIF
jgi:hypothetical protein